MDGLWSSEDEDENNVLDANSILNKGNSTE
jgi:hypothetical protein